MPQPSNPAAYTAALQLVQSIDRNLATGRHHYRTRDGQLLHHLDQVVDAILTGTIDLPSPAGRGAGGEGGTVS